MSENRSQPDHQQKQPKKSKKPSLVRKLRNPKTLIFLFQTGFNAYRAGKWLLQLELVKLLIELLGF